MSKQELENLVRINKLKLEPASRPEFDAYTLANTPATFARHGVLIAREVFDRA